MFNKYFSLGAAQGHLDFYRLQIRKQTKKKGTV